MSDLISIFQTCLYVCIAFTVLFFIITVVLFFVFDIRTIFNIRTGRAKQKTIKEMQEANNTTGRLRVGGKTLTSQLAKDKKHSGKKTGKTGNLGVGSVNSARQYNPQGAAPTDVLPQEAAPTDVLDKPDVTKYEPGAQPTSQLTSSQQETTVLNTNSSASENNEKKINISITKKILVIHTKEFID